MGSKRRSFQHAARRPAVAALLGVAQVGLAQVCLAQARPSPAQTPEPWEAPAEAKQLQNPVKTDPRTVERGKKLYREQCLPCHGQSGVGDGVMARKMGYQPANLTLERLNRQADGEIFWKISKGRPPMPDFETQISERERWDIVSYVRTLLKLGR